MNPGKIFEDSFKSSVPSTAFIYRFRDSATSFSKDSSTRFTPSNIADYLLLDNKSRTMYLLELKSTKGASLPLSNIRKSQIDGLTEASVHNLIAGFVVNFRVKENFTCFISIQNFNQMVKSLGKKSFNIENLKDNGCVEILNKKKRTRYQYDVEKFINDTKIEDELILRKEDIDGTTN